MSWHVANWLWCQELAGHSCTIQTLLMNATHHTSRAVPHHVVRPVAGLERLVKLQPWLALVSVAPAIHAAVEAPAAADKSTSLCSVGLVLDLLLDRPCRLRQRGAACASAYVQEKATAA